MPSAGSNGVGGVGGDRVDNPLQTMSRAIKAARQAAGSRIYGKSSHVSRDITAAFKGGGIDAAAPDLPTLSEEEIHNPVIWKCLEIPAEDGASCRLRLREGTEDDPGDILKPGDHEAAEVMNRINPVDDQNSFLRQVFKDARGAGDTFWFQHLTVAGTPMGFERLLPHDITPIAHRETIIGSYDWETSEAQGRLGRSGYVHIGIPMENMFHVRNGSNPNSPRRGLGALERLRYQIAMGQTMDDWNYNRYSKGIPTEYMIFYRGKYSPGEREEHEELLRSKLGGSGGDNFILIDADANGEQTFDVKLFPRPTEDELAFLDSEERIKYRIAMALGVPPNKLQDFSQSTVVANSDAMERLYWEDTVKNNLHRPLLGYLNQTWLPRFWLGDQVFFEFDYSQVRALQKSEVERASVNVLYLDRAVITRNEVRQEIGKDQLTVLDKDGMNLMDVPLQNGRPLGQDTVSMLDLFGAPGSGNGDGRDEDPKDEGLDENEDGPDRANEDEIEDAKRALIATGKVVAIQALRNRIATEKMIPRDILNLSAEEKIFSALVRSKIRRMMQRAGEQQLEISGISGVFNMSDPQVLEALEKQVVQLASVTHTINERVRLAIAEGLETGAPIASMRASISDALKASRQPYQLDRIARTEVHAAQERASLLSAEQNGVEFKRWITARDSLVRGLELDADADHNGIELLGPIKINMPFVDPISGANMMFPGDRAGAITGADTINCRCSFISDFSHLDLSARKSRKAPLDITGAWFEKASTRDAFELDFKRTIKSYFMALERRVLAEYDRQAADVLEATSVS